MPKTVRARSASDGVDSAMELWEVVFLSISCLMVCAFSMSTLAVLGIRTHDEHAWRETLFVVGSSLRSVFFAVTGDIPYLVEEHSLPHFNSNAFVGVAMPIVHRIYLRMCHPPLYG
jgi:hypothetical protein